MHLRSYRRRHAFTLITVTALVAAMLAASPPAAAAVTISPTKDALALAQSMVADPSVLGGATLVTHPPQGTSSAVATGTLAGFPTAGGSFAIMTTGDPRLADRANTSGSSGVSLGGSTVRGNSDFDVTILRIDLNVPANMNCLGLDFRFLSEEYPEWVGTSFNDAFIAELDRSTWTTSGSRITAPDNFAFDPDGNVISINAAGVTSMTRDQAAGTTYDGATPLLSAATPVSPGPHSLYLSIFDQGDRVYDSAVFVDSVRVVRVADVARHCREGAQLADHTKHVGLGDSFSSGFGVTPYEPGTNKDDGPNNCQRSDHAFAQEVARDLGFQLSFHACQGGLTKDFYTSRDDREGQAWGEPPQLDHLSVDTGFVTFTIGGNDAKFADVLAECILGFELLPFNTCYKDKKVTEPVAEAFARLDNQAATPVDITPYDKLFKDVRRRAPFSSVVTVGYPRFYTASGGDRTFLPGGRCEGVKKADQRWMVEKIDEMNEIIERNASRNGFLFADTSPRFEGHELCSGGTEWIFGILSSGRFHPKREGHRAMADAVIDAIAVDGRLRYLVHQDQSVTFNVIVEFGKKLLSLVSDWPGSDVVMSMTTPSGRTITRGTEAPDVAHENGPAYERFEITDPEPGTWEVTLFGADVAPEGEEVAVTVHQEDPPNMPPVAHLDWDLDGTTLALDGSASHDPDGTITSHDWYISTTEEDTVLVGPQVSFEMDGRGPFAVTLVVTDDRGATAFADTVIAAVDVMPGDEVGAINPDGKGLTPVVLLSSEDLDATTIDASTLRFGPGGATATRTHHEDVDGDGLADLVVHFRTQDAGFTPADDRACVSGALPDGVGFEGCDAVRVVPPSGRGG